MTQALNNNPYGIQDHLTVDEINEIVKGLRPDDIVGMECKHAVYTVSNKTEGSDLVTVKQLIHLKDGRKIPTLKFFRDYERPFWITQPRHQNHTDKKEWEYKDKLIERTTRQCNLRESICRALGYGNPKGQLKTLARSPYLYGVDITTPTLIKAKYQQTWPDLFTPNTVAVIDSETDVVNGSGTDPILLTITFRDRVLVTVDKNWIKDVPNFVERVHEACAKHLKEDFEARKIKMDIVICDTHVEMIKRVIEACHQWQPDFVTFWNMDYDMTVMLNCLEKENVDMAELFSDKRVPPEYRYFNYRRGPTMKVKADGSIENLASYDRWNVVEFPASFQFIDAMCVYRQIRKASGKAPSYSLDYTLRTNLEGRHKLYFEIDDKNVPEGGIEWHVIMQMRYKVEYTVYNIFDCIGVELLDEKTRDLQTQISVLSGYSEYSIFTSNPKRTSDKLHFFCLNIGKVASCVSDQMANELDKLVLSKEDWIVTLPTHSVDANGLKILEEVPEIQSLIRMYVSDADIESTYPNGEIVMNLSKETTMMEMCKVEGISKSRQRLLGVNLTGGPSNAVEIMTEVAKLPGPDQMLELYMQRRQ